MGNKAHKKLANCCSQDFFQNKKEVSFYNDKIEFEGATPRLIDENHKRRKVSNDNDIPLKQLEASQLEFKSNTLFHDDFNKLKYLEQISPTAPILILKVLNSPNLALNTEIIINVQGVEGSLRGKKDGITYFGTNEKLKSFGLSEPIIDYNLGSPKIEIEDRNKHMGRHFQIEYSIDSHSYKIRDLGLGYGAFVRMDDLVLLKNNNLLSMGTSFLVVNLEDGVDEIDDSLLYTTSQDDGNRTKEILHYKSTQNDDSPKVLSTDYLKTTRNSEITVKIFGGANYGEIFRFDAKTPLVKIGRMADCEIRLDDSLMSKYQATLKYVPKSGWTLYDGYNGKASTNNNWLYLNDDFEIFDGMVFKANHTLFEAILKERIQL